MRRVPPREEILSAELAVLRAMCTGTPEGTVWDKGMLLLGTYPFRDNVHQLIFEVLQEINTDFPDVIRKQLPARLTKKGFPSVPHESFLAPHGLSAAEAVERMRQLRLWASSEERPDATVR
ncbi:MAG: hypothetical protein L0212_11070 [Acidobacteria bacterium]|nr:hypothetical protein [Acidobacteriota bacterium]